MNHIFISYSRKDADIVFPIVDRLRAEGLNIWQDVSGAGTGIPFSTKWFDVIEEAMYLAGGAIVFHSENWKASVPCQNEYDLIMKCRIPGVVLETDRVAADPEDAVRRVHQFVKDMVDTKYNEIRTKLVSSAYEYREGAKPAFLIPKTRGVLGFADYVFFELRPMRRIAAKDDYKNANPEIYPFIKKYLRFAGVTAAVRICSAVLIALTVAAAVLMLLAVPKAYKETAEGKRLSYIGLAASEKIGQNAAADPLKAIRLAQEVDESTIKNDSYHTLYRNGQLLLNANLPERVIGADDPVYERIASTEAIRESPLFIAEFTKNAGCVAVTDRETGIRRTVNAPCQPHAFSWSDDGETLLYAAGTGVFAYDACGMGDPVRLWENFGQIERVVFTALDGVRFAAAVTKDGYALLWRLPAHERAVRRSGVNYGVFTEGDTPEAVFIDGKDIVIARENGERIITPTLDGTIQTPCYDVSADGSRIAFICKKDAEAEIVCVSLETGEILAEAHPSYTPTAVAFSAEADEICASAQGCGILKVNVASGEILYGSYDAMYFQNIARYGENWVLTDYAGFCCVFDGSLRMLKDCGAVNYLCVPFFSLTVDAERGLLFTVNRGGANNLGCTRFQLETGEKNMFVISEMQGVDSNTAAAVSADGRYVAFGYPNGTVRVHEEAQMYLAFEFCGLGESVAAIRFSDDGGELYVLGGTGRIFRLKLSEYEIWNGEETMRENWRRLVNSLAQKKNDYIAGLPAEE